MLPSNQVFLFIGQSLCSGECICLAYLTETHVSEKWLIYSVNDHINRPVDGLLCFITMFVVLINAYYMPTSSQSVSQGIRETENTIDWSQAVFEKKSFS